MNDIIRLESDDRDHLVPRLPEPKLPGVRIRPGVLSDYGFIDELQKKHKKAVGFMWESAIKGHIEKGNVLIAEAPGSAPGSDLGSEPGSVEPQGCGDQAGDLEGVSSGCAQTTGGTPIPPKAVGYVLGVDRYLKRDELGIIYQLNVVPGRQRGLIGANLLKAKFEASAYGCRLYCCWCAQDLAANRFWEACGFVPLAFRTGGGRRKKEGPRMHIFWQKRIRPGKFDSQTNRWVEDDYPYWFPSQTGAGAIGEDRLVLPIPPGTHWRDAKPVVLPEGPSVGAEAKLLEARVSALQKAKKAACKKTSAGSVVQKPVPKPAQSASVGGLHFGARPKSADEVAMEAAKAEAKEQAEAAAKLDAELKEAKKAAKRAKKKFDPAQEAVARELKDRWLEQVAARPGLLAPGSARYDVSRQIAPGRMDGKPVALVGGERLGLPDAA